MISWKSHIAVAITILSIIASAWPSSAQNTGGDRLVRPPLLVQAQSETAVLGFRPEQIRKAYGFDRVANGGAGQTIGIVVAFDHDRIEQDLDLFSKTFGLPACTSANGCFRKIFSTEKNPSTKAVWTLETALDVEWAHAIAPDAHILLVEAPSDRLDDMLDAVDVAVLNGATVVSMSWGAPEFADQLSNDNRFVASGVMFVAGSGNTGEGTLYPSTSPNVVAVGGTSLTTDANGRYLSETAWNGSGGGLSPIETEPDYQSSFQIPNNPLHLRGVPDVAYHADPASGFAVYNSHPVFGLKGWFQQGGTSAATPQWAALFAIVNSSRAAKAKAPLIGSPAVLYNITPTNNYNDITTGANGSCALCSATSGYDYVTGLGSPKARSLIQALVNKP